MAVATIVAFVPVVPNAGAVRVAELYTSLVRTWLETPAPKFAAAGVVRTLATVVVGVVANVVAPSGTRYRCAI